MRHTHIDLASVLAQPTPQVDLRLQAYETSTSNFLRAVTNYTNRAIAEITKHRDAQEADKRKLAERIQAVESEINQCKLKEIDLLAVLAKEQEERRDAEHSLAALKRQLTSIRDTCATLDSEIEQYRTDVSNLQREKNSERDILNEHATRLEPELAACESWLQCNIEGIEADQLLIRFSHVDEANPDREFSFVLDVSTPSYNVITTTPLLPALPILLRELNQTGEVYRFIKCMRAAFRDLVQAQS
ncbi:chromosome segregation protein Spc25-domain-containing protein [Boletus edulis BED1]|uniref:Kinetochore protein SPC25 n=1 Tax=Boletus edulis BED1 TaxID=1328754 RepID=A0AAD4GF95_BOLED|nr:chromosome segregation protein Spc25-domain-containing protein [Boletus edulis BED1]KAF8439477.1 chromosome segregation protein Spc25-domain-containing protein [Boletus edulis BED1]